MTGAVALSIDSATVTFGATTALPPVSLTVGTGEVVAVMGPSGSGKSTLLAVISGSIPANAGRVEVLGHDLGSASVARRAALRRREMGLVFQDADLLPELDVAENVALLLLFDGVRRAQALGEAARALSDVGLGGADRMSVEQLSGGERQRVAVARALARPSVRLVVADEPTAALDAAMTAEIAGLLVQRVRARGASLVVATHDDAVAGRCDRVVNLRPHLAYSAPDRSA